MRATLLLVGVLLSFSAGLQAASGGDGDEESLSPLNNICQLPRDSGFGNVYQARFFYNTDTKACESFLYEGQGGNANNFWDEETCTQFCTSQGIRKRCPEPIGFGTCAMHCHSDADCGEGKLCCSNGCGQQCQDAVEKEP